MQNYQCIGVDIAKDKFDACLVLNDKKIAKIFSNQPEGFKKFLSWIKHYCTNPWVGMEATGHYSEGLADFLYQHKVQVSVSNALQVKYFGKAKLMRSKTDNIDAWVNCEYIQCMKPRFYEPMDINKKQVRQLVQLIDMLKDQLVQLKNQLASGVIGLAKAETKKSITSLENRIKRLKKKLESEIKKHEDYVKMVQLLTSIKGIAEESAYRLIAYLPDISLFSNAKQLSAYAGLSPRLLESGRYKGKTKLSKFGNSKLRKTLYMPALNIKRYKGAFEPFINRLEKSGLARKAITGAIMRKLIHIIYGMLKSNMPFDPELC